MASLVHNETTAEDTRRTEDDHSRCSKSNGSKNIVTDKSQSGVGDPAKCDDNYVFTLWKNKKISINKSLIFMRIALFLWFGAGRLPSLFLSVFMKSRGLTLIEYSTAFSFIFLFQFVISSVSGVIADKIGRGKPLLLFHVLATVAVLFGLLLTPSVDSETCQSEKNLTCSHIFETNANSTFCFINCFQNFTENHYNNRNSVGNLKNESFSEYSGMFIESDGENISNSFLEFVNSNSCNEICASTCVVPFENDCVKTRNKLLVILYTVWIFSIYSFRSIAYRFMDFTALCLISTSDSHFGRERFFAISGEITLSIFVTFILNIDKTSKSAYNYDSVLWLSDAVLLCSFLLICNVKVPNLPPGRNLLQKVSAFSKDLDFWAFAFIIYVAGNGFCFNLNFHFLLLEKIKAPKILFGIISITFGLYGIPVLLTSRWWINKFGTCKIFVFSLLCYSVNHFAFSFLYNPWMSLLIEITNPFSFHLFWVAVVIHCQNTAPQGFVATFTAVAGALHFGIGRSSGVLIGGLLINYLGQRTAYRVTASFFLLVAILYSVFFYIRGKSCEKAVEVTEQTRICKTRERTFYVL